MAKTRIVIGGEDELSPVLNEISAHLKKLGHDAKSSFSEAEAGVISLEAAVELGKQAWEAISESIGESIEKYKESETIQTRLDTMFANSASTIGLTKNAIDGLSESLARNSIYDDDAIKNSEALLMSFTNIRGDVFEKTVQASADMASAMGVDLKQATEQLGRAINDPIKGFAMLNREGIQFTATEKEQITQMQQSNDVMGAQNEMLDILQKRFGGVSKALAESAAGSVEKFNQALEDSQKAWGKILTDVLGPIESMATPVLRAFSSAILDNRDANEKFVDSVQEIIDKSREQKDQYDSILGPITKKNEDEKLTLDQYNKMIQVYPELKGQIDAYSTSLRDAEKAAEAQEKRAKAQARALLEVAYAQAKAAQVQAEQNIGQDQSDRHIKVKFDVNDNVDDMQKQLYQKSKEIYQKEQEAQNEGNTQEALAYAQQMDDVRKYIAALKDELRAKQDLANFDNTGNVVEKSKVSRPDNPEVSKTKAKTESLKAEKAPVIKADEMIDFSNVDDLFGDKIQAALATAQQKAQSGPDPLKPLVDKGKQLQDSLTKNFENFTISAAQKVTSLFTQIQSLQDQQTQAQIANQQSVLSDYTQNADRQVQIQKSMGYDTTQAQISAYNAEKQMQTQIQNEQKQAKRDAWESNHQMQIVNATMGVAQAIISALSLPPPFGEIEAGIVGALGATQLAVIMSQPEPQFASGGIVPGQFFSGDLVSARLNSGEMVLNQSQQSNLFALANQRQSSGGGGHTFNFAGAHFYGSQLPNDFVRQIYLQTNLLTKDGRITQ